MSINEARQYVLARKVLILFTAISFVAFFIEVYLGHYLWFQLFAKRGVLSPAMIPIFFSVPAFIVSLMAAVWMSPVTVTLFRWTMVASLAIGLAGTGYHVAARVNSLSGVFNVATWLGDPPAFAPLAYGLPALMGLVATFGIQWKRTPAKEPAQAASAIPQGPVPKAQAG